MNKVFRDNIVKKFIAIGIGAIFIIAPFYAPITVLLASRLQHFDLLRIWKEVMLTGIGLVVLYFLITHLDKTKKIFKEKLFKYILIYAGLLVSISIYDSINGRVATPAIIYGLMINLRLVGIFTVVYLAFKTKQLNTKFAWWKYVMIPAVFVVTFGFLQMTILPDDALKHIGYNKQTIVPFQTVDNQPDFARIQSSLRGPNPLGAYLLLIITLIFGFIIKEWNTSKRKWLILLFVLSLIVLYGTFSRSAFIGTVISLLVMAILYKNRFVHFIKHPAFITVTAISFILVTSFYMSFKNNYIFETTVYHNSSKSDSAESSNSQRKAALVVNSKDVLENPLGSGVGSAGPASLRNTNGGGKLSENYFIQVGQETGFIGMFLFILITFLIAQRLYWLRHTLLAKCLLASLAGLIFVNLISHAWADDTIAYLWWGLAGIALADNTRRGGILNTNKKKHKHEDIKTTT